MSERGPFEQLGDLIDEPVAPREAFAAELRARLMSDMSASEHSREEQRTTMEGAIPVRPTPVVPIERFRRVRPVAILELAAAALIIVGLAAILSSGWFDKNPKQPTSLPAAALQGDGTPTPAITPTVESPQTANSDAIPTEAPTVEALTAFQAGGLPGTVWTIPSDGELINFGGMIVEDGIVYRLLETSNFTGVQAVDGGSGTVTWQQPYTWTGKLFAIEEDMLFFGGENGQLIALDAKTGAEKWSAKVDGNPVAMTDEDDRVFVLTDSDVVVALNLATGDQLWVAQGQASQNPTGGSTSIPAIGQITVEGDTVAAMSSTGVLSGFDVASGEELWSHEGYGTAPVTIIDEDGRFVVASGGSSSTVAMSVGSLDDSMEIESESDDGTPHGVGIAGGDCLGIFDAMATGGDMMVSATPGAAAGAGGSGEITFQVQSIDATTGDIVWEQQAGSGGASGTAEAGPGGPILCTVDVESGQIGIGSSSMQVIEIGTIESSGAAVTLQTDDDEFVVVGEPANASEQPIAAVSDDGEIYLQLADGSLVKVESPSSSNGDDQHDDHEDSDDTPESDDD